MHPRPSHRGIRHLALNVVSFEEMKRFYTEILGFEIEWAPDPDNVYLTSGADNLALHRAAPARSRVATAEPPPAAALDHLGLIVRTEDDVDAWARYLSDRSVRLEAPPKTHRDGARSCYLRDPDGNRIQIIHHPPISNAS